MITLTVFSLAAILLLTDGQITTEPCPESILTDGFQLGKFMGTWYDIQRTYTYASAMYQCTLMNLTLLSNGTIEIAQHNSVYLSLLRSEMKGYANIMPNKPARWNIRTDSPLLTSTWDIVATDYDNYAIAWACKSLETAYFERHLWVIARKRYPTSDIMDKIDKKIKELQLSTTFLRDVRSRFLCPKETGYEIISL